MVEGAQDVYSWSSHAVEWADLPIVDISKAHTPEGRAELAPQMHDAMRTHGFLYIVNHGLTQAQVRLPPTIVGLILTPAMSGFTHPHLR